MLKTNLTFNAGQLGLVRSCAEECIGDGESNKGSRISDEWAVFETVKFASESFAADQLVIMHLIAKQCEKRHLGAMSVYDCVVAFNGIFAGEELAQFPALVASVVDSAFPQASFNIGGSTYVPLRIDFGADGMGPFSLN